MKKRYIFLSLVPIILAIVLALLPDKSKSIDSKRNKMNLKSAKYTGITPDNLLIESVNNDRFVQPDELAKVILGQDPSYILIDLRDSIQFEKFTLPYAINIPVEKILEEQNHSVLTSKAHKIVLFSNGTIVPDQVWMILRRAGIKNLKVLNGGVNQFYQLYMNPPKPLESDPKEVFENYSFRKAVGAYLGLPNPDEFIPEGGPINPNMISTGVKMETLTKSKPKVITPVKTAVGKDEGC